MIPKLRRDDGRDQVPHNLGQGIWLGMNARELLDGGTPERYVTDLLARGLTSNPVPVAT
jgi:hypothetical protein